MKRLFFAIFLFISLEGFASPLYEQTIYVEQIDDEQFNRSLDDFIVYLKKCTGQRFVIKQFSGQIATGIYLLWNKSGLLENSINKKLKEGTTEDFVLSGNNNRLLMIANHPKGFSLAIYTYLDLLGVKWYFPGTKWEYIPSRADISYLGAKYFSPSFHVRTCFGTGGVRAIKDIDPNATVAREWNDWKRRNRLGGEFDVGGHYGEVFNYKHKGQLEAHPEYLAMVNGKRQWTANNKWCISNKELQKLFVADRIDELKAELKKRKFSNEQIVLSVDPADGADDCECDNCKKLGTASQRTFFLANKVAIEFAKISPLAYANIYAYSTHSQPPGFRLAPNLVVQIVPYAFQNVGTPEQMIGAWKRNHSNLLIYDYYCLPDWHHDYPLPYKTSPDTLVKRIKSWRKQGLHGFTLESTYSIGIAGLGLYLMSQLSWDINGDVNKIKRNFLQNMFGGANAKMGEFYDLISKYQGVAEVSYLYSILNEIDDNTNTLYHERISDLKAYLHYLVLFYQVNSNLIINHALAWENIMDYVWRIYPSKMVHSTRMAELLYAWAPNNNLAKQWSFYEPISEKIKRTKFLNAKEINDIATQDMVQYPLLQSFPYAKAKLFRYDVISKANRKDSSEMLFLNWPETFIEPGSNGYFEFFVKLRKESGLSEDFTAKIPIACIDTFLQKTIYAQTQTLGFEWKKVSIRLPEKKSYRLSLELKPWILVKVPNDQWIGFSNVPVYSAMDTLWFYVPPGTRYFYYINNSEDQPVFNDPNSNKVTAKKVNDLNIYSVNTESKSGQWWSISNTQYKHLQFFLKDGLFFTHSNYRISPN